MYAKITNGIVEKYPYTIGNLRKDNPNISFPKIIDDLDLEFLGVFKVEKREQPEISYDQNIQCKVVKQSGKWVESWKVTNASSEEVAQRVADKIAQVRYERNQYLSESDWTQVSDAPVDKNAWATYRQALRDITDQDGFPWDVQWPIKP
jgi:hypothetical protein